MLADSAYFLNRSRIKEKVRCSAKEKVDDKLGGVGMEERDSSKITLRLDRPRRGWCEVFACANTEQEEDLDGQPNRFDEDEWTW